MSFHTAKMITTIEGGMIFTINSRFYKNHLIKKHRETKDKNIYMMKSGPMLE